MYLHHSRQGRDTVAAPADPLLEGRPRRGRLVQPELQDLRVVVGWMSSAPPSCSNAPLVFKAQLLQSTP